MVQGDNKTGIIKDLFAIIAGLRSYVELRIEGNSLF